MKRRPEVKFISCDGAPQGALDTAERRTTPILRAWAARPDFDLLALAVSLYLQGVADGYAAAESQSTKGNHDRNRGETLG